MRALTWLPADDDAPFPPLATALRHPNGLLAVGGTLAPRRLLRAYAGGIFPWYGKGQSILWWSPDPRMVLFPEELHTARRWARKLRSGRFRFSADRAFVDVIRGCAGPRPDQNDTWITSEMAAAYLELHRLGHAHSIEVWLEARLVGGIYGVGMNRVFFGESMFSRVPDASKMALSVLCGFLRGRGARLIDCQVYSEHLHRLGAREIPRDDFVCVLKDHAAPSPERWTLSSG